MAAAATKPRAAAAAVYSKDYISGKTAELAARLLSAQSALSRVDQDALPAGIDNLAGSIVQQHVLRNKDESVRLLACCCLVDILRLYAPDAPYTDSQKLEIFREIVEQLKAGLRSSSGGDDEGEGSALQYERCLYILTSFDAVKTPLILTEMLMNEEEGEGGEEDDESGGDAGSGSTQRATVDKLLVDLFNALINCSLRNGVSKDTEGKAVGIICAILEELTVLPSPLLETLLRRCINPEATPRCFELVCSIISSQGEKLSPAIASFIKASLTIEDADAGFESKGSKKKHPPQQGHGARLSRTEVLTILSHVAPAIPSILDTLIPILVEELRSAPPRQQFEAMTVLGQLFKAQPSAASADMASAPGAVAGRVPFGSIHRVSFVKWLKCALHSEDNNILRSAIQHACDILSTHACLADEISEQVKKRMTHADEDIRKCVVVSVGDAMSERLANVPADLVEALCERARRDKKMSVQREAISAITQAYYRSMAPIWTKQEAWAAGAATEAALGIRSDEVGHGAGAGAKKQQGRKGAAAAAASSEEMGSGAVTSLQSPLLTPPANGSLSPYELTPNEMETCKKLAPVPAALIDAYAEAAVGEIKWHAQSVIDFVVLPEALDDKLRARALAFFYASLPPTHRHAFATMCGDRRRVQVSLSGYLTLVDQFKAARANESKVTGEELNVIKRRIDVACNDFAKMLGSAKALGGMRALAYHVVDRTIFRSLALLCAPAGFDGGRLRITHEGLKQSLKLQESGSSGGSKVGAKGAAAAASEMVAMCETVRLLVRRLAPFTFSSAVIQRLVWLSLEAHAITSRSILGSGGVSALIHGHSTTFGVDTRGVVGVDDTLSLLSLAAKEFPAVFVTPPPVAIKLTRPSAPPVVSKARPSTVATGGGAGSKRKAGAPPVVEGGAGDEEEGIVAAGGSPTASATGTATAAVDALVSVCRLIGSPLDAVSTGALSVLASLGPSANELLPLGSSMALHDCLFELATGSNAARGRCATATAIALLSTGDARYRFSEATGAGSITPRSVDASNAEPDALLVRLATALSSAQALSTSNANLVTTLAGVCVMALRAPALFARIDGCSNLDRSPTAVRGGRTEGGGGGSVTQRIRTLLLSDPFADAPAPKGWLLKRGGGGVAAVLGMEGASFGGAGDGDANDWVAESEGGDDDDDNSGTGGGSAAGAGAGAGAGGGDDSDAAEETSYKRKTKASKGVKRKGGGGGGRAAGRKKRQRAADFAIESLGICADGIGAWAYDAAEDGDWAAGRFFDISYSALVRVLALKSQGAIARGLTLRSRALQVACQLAASEGGAAGAGGEPRTDEALVRQSAQLALTRGTTAVGDALRFLAANGALHHTSGKFTATGEAAAAAMRATSVQVAISVASAGGGLLDNSVMPIGAWLRCSYALADAHAGVRAVALASLHRGLLPSLQQPRPSLSLRWLASLSLAAMPSGEEKQSGAAAQAVFDAAAHMFALHAKRLRERLSAESDDTARTNAAVARALPESSLPFALWLLAHDPSPGRFPSEDDAVEFQRAREKSGGGGVRGFGPFHAQASCLASFVDALEHASVSSLEHNHVPLPPAGRAKAHASCQRVMHTLYGHLGNCEDLLPNGSGKEGEEGEGAGAGAGVGASAASASAAAGYAIPPAAFDDAVAAAASVFFAVLKPRMKDSSAFDPALVPVGIPPSLFKKRGGGGGGGK